ncbi:MAG: excinuclease ABC subunit UvrC [Alphaproteobacteria bacterium]
MDNSSGKKSNQGDGVPSIRRGVEIISSYADSLPLRPGVYRMIAADGGVLYVGKAKALKKRVSSYTHFEALSQRLQKMVSLTVRMEFITTHTEAEALLLEANLIKKLKPRYNILLRDDKSFPYILIDQEYDFPQVKKHRGAKKQKGLYYGPFPSAGDVNRALSILQRVFMLRNCSDHVFQNRSRPCLQYHIKRCTAPCVAYVNKADYARQVKGARDFMEGKGEAVRQALVQEMQEASRAEDYERAAILRDRIRALTSVQARYDVNSELGDADVMGIYSNEGVSCIQVFFYRGGRSLGNKAYFPRHGQDEEPSSILSAFVGQFYQNKPIPKRIVLSMPVEDPDLLQQALCEYTGRAVGVIVPKRGKYRRIADFAENNAQQALDRHLAHSATRLSLRRGVADVFGLDELPRRIEVYDNSHISGKHMVGAMVVEGVGGFEKSAYRTFNIKIADQSDDYGMMREVLSRRFQRALKGGQGPGSDSWPDLLLIDGGKGQLNVCLEVLEEMGIVQSLSVVAIAKGPDRNAGREQFFMEGREVFQLPENDPVLHYLQRLRDEAHRFAIGAHRSRRGRALSQSGLDQIPGIGAKRKKALLLHFGSAKDIEAAGVDELARVSGISRAMAQNIYDFFRD